eukprot:scaffold7006_cov108-Isochrysis_galbana.AAC.5
MRNRLWSRSMPRSLSSAVTSARFDFLPSSQYVEELSRRASRATTSSLPSTACTLPSSRSTTSRKWTETRVYARLGC